MIIGVRLVAEEGEGGGHCLVIRGSFGILILMLFGVIKLILDD